MATTPAAPQPSQPQAAPEPIPAGAVLGSSIETEGPAQIQGRTQLEIFWRRFRRHRLGLAGLGMLILLVLASWVGPKFSPYTFNELDLNAIYQGPSRAHPFGTSALGEDNLTRTLVAGQVSLRVGLFTALAACLVGTILGLVAGWRGGWLDGFLARITDMFLIVPAFVVLIVLAITFSQIGLYQIIFIIALLAWAPLFRLVRGSVLRTKELEFVQAARAVGAGGFRIMVRHLLPSAVPEIVVFGTLAVGIAILTETALSFLGLGINPQVQPSWGNQMIEARSTIERYWWLTIFPGMFVLATVLAVNFLGDALRDAIDPYGMAFGGRGKAKGRRRRGRG